MSVPRLKAIGEYPPRVIVLDGALDFRTLVPVDAQPGFHWEAMLEQYSYELMLGRGGRRVEARVVFIEVRDGEPEKSV